MYITSNNDAIINNNYGRLQDLILLYKNPMGTQKNFLKFLRDFEHAPDRDSHGTTVLSLNGFSWSLVFECFYRIRQGNSSNLEIWRERRVDCDWNVMAHAQKPDFVFRRKGRVHLNRLGASVQSTAGSRGVRISCSNAGYTMFRGSVKGTGYPLHLNQ